MEGWREYLVWLLKHNDKAVLRAAMLVYKNGCQNMQRINAGGERLPNRGFNRWDAEHLIPIVEDYIAHQRIRPGQLQRLHQAMPKYWRQVLEVVQSKLEREGAFEVAPEAPQRPACPCEYGYCGECTYGQRT